MSTATEKAVPAIKEDVQAVSTAIQGILSAGDNGAFTTSDPDWYKKSLPEGLTEEQYTSLAAHNTKVLAGATHALGVAAIPLMEKNPKLETATLVLPMIGKDAIKVTFERSTEKVERNEAGEVTGTKTSYGVTRQGFDIYGEGSNRGQLSVVKKNLAALAMAALKK